MRTVAVVLMLVIGAAARAEDARAVYMEAVRTMMPPERYDQMIEMMYRPLVAGAEANSKQKMPADAVQQLRDAARSSMSYDELLGWTADAYERHFTPQEMQQMTAFFRSPLGKKLEQEQPRVQAEIMRKVAEVVPQRIKANLGQGQPPPKKAPQKKR